MRRSFQPRSRLTALSAGFAARYRRIGGRLRPFLPSVEFDKLLRMDLALAAAYSFCRTRGRGSVLHVERVRARHSAQRRACAELRHLFDEALLPDLSYLPGGHSGGRGLDFFLYSTTPTGDAWIDQTWSMRPTLGLVVGHLLTATRHPAQLNSAIWSLIVEIHASMIFPVLFWAVRRARPVLLLGICAVLSGVLPLIPHGSSIAGLTISPGYLALFAGGILLWLHLPSVSRFLINRREMAWCGAIAFTPLHHRAPCA